MILYGDRPTRVTERCGTKPSLIKLPRTEKWDNIILSSLGATAFRIPHGTGRCNPKTGVPQKLRSHIDTNILKQTYFLMR